MKTFGRYFGYITKKSILRTVIFTLIALAIVLASMHAGLDRSHGVINNGTAYDNRVTNIGEISTVLGFLCGIIPIIELAGFKSRRNIDALYSFPIKRWKMATAHYLSGFIQITLIHSVCFFTSYIYYLLNTDFFALEYMIPYFFASLGLGIIMYSVFMFINSQANTVVDGVLFSVLWIFALALLLETAVSFVRFFDGGWHNLLYDSGCIGQWGIIFGPLNNVTVIFQKLIHINDTYTGSIMQQYVSKLYMIFVWLVIGAGASVGYFVTFIKKPAHKTSEISDSFFGYRTLLPIYCFTCILLLGWLFGLITPVIFIAMTIIGYVIFRRGFRFKLPDILSMVGSLIVAVILVFFLNK